MKVYGVTIISSEGDCFTKRADGQIVNSDSITEIFSDKKAAVDYAVKTMISNFDAYDFEENEGGYVVDCDGQDKEELEDALRAGENITIQSYDEHLSIETFERELEMPKEKTPRKYILITTSEPDLDLSVEEFPSADAAHDEMLKQILDQSDYNSEEELVDEANAGLAGYSDDEAWAVSRRSCGTVVWKIVAVEYEKSNVLENNKRTKATTEDLDIIKQALLEDNEENSAEYMAEVLMDDSVSTWMTFEHLASDYIYGSEDFRKGLDDCCMLLTGNSLRTIAEEIMQRAKEMEADKDELD